MPTGGARDARDQSHTPACGGGSRAAALGLRFVSAGRTNGLTELADDDHLAASTASGADRIEGVHGRTACSTTARPACAATGCGALVATTEYGAGLDHAQRRMARTGLLGGGPDRQHRVEHRQCAAPQGLDRR